MRSVYPGLARPHSFSFILICLYSVTFLQIHPGQIFDESGCFSCLLRQFFGSECWRESGAWLLIARPYSLGLGWCGAVLGGANLTVAPVLARKVCSYLYGICESKSQTTLFDFLHFSLHSSGGNFQESCYIRFPGSTSTVTLTFAGGSNSRARGNSAILKVRGSLTKTWERQFPCNLANAHSAGP